MPKGKRGKRSSSIFMKFRGTIVLKGPLAREGWLRNRLESKLRRSLERCPYLRQSGLAARQAFKIAWSATFAVVEKYERGIINVKHLDVVYLNPGSHWKWWSRWRQNRDTLVITGDFFHEGAGTWP